MICTRVFVDEVNNDPELKDSGLGTEQFDIVTTHNPASGKDNTIGISSWIVNCQMFYFTPFKATTFSRLVDQFLCCI